MNIEQEKKYLRVLIRRHQEGKPTMVLKCSGCGHQYSVGVDSIIVTNRDVTEMFANTEQLKACGVFSHSPDLVATVASPDRELLGRACANAGGIALALWVGEEIARQWHCRECDEINVYDINSVEPAVWEESFGSQERA
jgi:RNase P subunit RPR2